MAIKQCPECGQQFALSALRCPDDDHELVEVLAGDQRPVGSDAGLAGPTIGELLDAPPTPVGTATSAVGPEVADATPAGAGVAVDEAVTADGSDRLDDDEDDDDEQDDDGDGDDQDGDDEHVTYEMAEWSGEARVMLEQLLAGASIARVWEGTDLVVRAEDEGRVDDLVEQVRATDQPMLDPDAEKVVYGVAGWTTEQLVSLTDRLAAVGIGYEFDMEGDLVVLATDEDQVDAFIDASVADGEAVDTGDDPEGDVGDDEDGGDEVGEGSDDADDDGDDGLVTAEILSDLFVACDRLQHNARDADGVLGAVSAADRLEGRRLPFGYEARVWRSLLGSAEALRDQLAGDDATDGDIQDAARSLRERLYHMV